jgi:hypothetical protein
VVGVGRGDCSCIFPLLSAGLLLRNSDRGDGGVSTEQNIPWLVAFAATKRIRSNYPRAKEFRNFISKLLGITGKNSLKGANKIGKRIVVMCYVYEYL